MTDLQFKSIFEKGEIEDLQSVERRGVQHPTRRILFPSTDQDKQVAINTEAAVQHLLLKRKDWLYSLKRRLLDVGDWTSASSALGEIRSYGALLDAGFNINHVTKGKTRTPDFIIEQSCDRVRLEVHSKQMNTAEREAWEQFDREPVIKSDGEQIGIREHGVFPFGRPKNTEPKEIKETEELEEIDKPEEPEESTTEIVIGKICSIKQDESQLSDTETSLLWLDFQDEAFWSFGPTSALPIGSSKGEFFSGALWYAHYGWKGAPIFENNTIELRADKRPGIMPHDGRFEQDSKVDGVLVSLPRATILFENPKSPKPIKQWLWSHLPSLRWFSFEYSWVDLPKGSLKGRIEIERQRLEDLGKKATYGW